MNVQILSTARRIDQGKVLVSDVVAGQGVPATVTKLYVTLKMIVPAG